MVGIQIPNLVMAHSEPGDSEPTKFGEHVIAKKFISLFRFRDGDKTWSAYFTTKISDLGTPKLLEVKVTGSTAEHPKPLSRTYTREDTREQVLGRGAWFSREELDEFARLQPEAESVERWQLKIVEQFRFQLLELGIRLAIELGEPMKRQSPDGEWQLVYLGREPFSESEIKKILKDIDKKIRQKITPDFLAKVASLYTAAGLRGERPIKAIEEFYKCSYRTAQDYATKAREQNLLPETTPGKVTVKKPKAKRVEK